MGTVTQQKFEPFGFLVVLASVVAAGVISVAVPATMPWSFIVLVAAALLVYWVARWDVMLLTWLWVGSYGTLDWDPLKVVIPGFFTMSPPRFIFLAAVLAYLLYFLLRRGLVRFDLKLLWLILAVVLYYGWSAHTTGWTGRVYEYRAAPYYRYISAVVLPFIMLWLVYNATRRERQIAWPLILVSIYGWYALYLGYLQFMWVGGGGAEWARALIWPSYVTDPEFGIHLDRGRGAFRTAVGQSVFLVMLFYMNLYSIRRIRGPWRAILILQAALTIPAIFFTGIRAGYVAFLVCGVVWCLWGSSYRVGGLKIAVGLLVLIVGVVVFWENLATTERRTGGVAQLGPIRSREVLVRQAQEIVRAHPWKGVGFGHFIDHQVQMARDPQSLTGMSPFMLSQHNVFLTLVCETGIPGLVGIVAIFVGVFWQSLCLRRKLPPTAAGWLSRDFVVLFWVIMLNFIVAGTFTDMLWEVPSCAMLWSMAGLVIGYNRLLDPHPIELPSA